MPFKQIFLAGAELDFCSYQLLLICGYSIDVPKKGSSEDFYKTHSFALYDV